MSGSYQAGDRWTIFNHSVRIGRYKENLSEDELKSVEEILVKNNKKYDLEPSFIEQKLWELGNKVPSNLYPIKRKLGAILRGTRNKIKSSKIEFDEHDSESFSVSEYKLNTSRSKFFNDIKKIKQYISEGDTYQVNYTVKGKFIFSGSYASFFKNLLFNQSAEYSAFINNENNFIISLSPELFFSKTNNKITTKPMKGTLSRSRELQSDALRAFELEKSEKNRAENLMIVDLLRNDLGKICKYGTVKVDKLFGIEKYESLFQMVSTIKGKLKSEISLSDIIKNIFPCGSITGAPKIRTMEIIKELEDQERGIYTGSIGMMSKESSVFNVAIRTIKIDKETGRGEVGLGSGIVWDSEQEKEYNETILKSEFLTKQTKPFELIETLLVQDGDISFLEDHINRIRKTADFFLFRIDEDKIRRELINTAYEYCSSGKHRMRLLLNKWGKLKLDYSTLEQLPKMLKVIISEKHINSENTFQYFKTTSRMLYENEITRYRKDDFFDVIFFNEKKELAEGAITNIFVRKEDVWFTPPVTSGILAGIYRNYFINTNENVKETIITINDLLTADEVKLVNSVRGEIKVNQLFYQNEFVEFT
ncbi:MAG: aminodeoxychorismate synthase component I [Bacteroidetes bacterium]|nr:aminodeoxychorismate synthase component I [Bacteroidota bacterium]